MKKIKSILTASICCIFLHCSFGQGVLDNTKIFSSVSLLDQDKRLFFFPHAEEVITNREESKIDWEASVYIQKRIFQLWMLSAWPGFGYSRFQTKFSRPFDHNYFTTTTGIGTFDLRYIDSYTIHKLVFPTSIHFSFSKKDAFFLNLTCIPAFDFNKRIRSLPNREWKHNKWKAEFFGIELNPGIGGKIGRMTFLLNYRYLNIVKLDRVIFNHLLFYTKDPPFLAQTYDDYNPTKVELTIGYDINRHD